ncbi:MAG: DUF2784 domain-containing protein [Candidatus Binatia bacterium]
MFYRALADCLVLVHLAFIVFVVVGSLLALRWRWIPWCHLPAVLWATLLEACGWICPLTPLENWLRHLGGATEYSGGFVRRYVVPIVYPAALTRDVQVALGILVCAFNAGLYWHLWRRRPRRLPPGPLILPARRGSNQDTTRGDER